MKDRRNFKCTLYYSIFRESTQALKKIFLEKRGFFLYTLNINYV